VCIGIKLDLIESFRAPITSMLFIMLVLPVNSVAAGWAGTTCQPGPFLVDRAIARHGGRRSPSIE